MATLHYRIRVRDHANSYDALVVTSLRGGVNPYLGPSVPKGDGTGLDLLTASVTTGAYAVDVVDEVGTVYLDPTVLRDPLDYPDDAALAANWTASGDASVAWGVIGGRTGFPFAVEPAVGATSLVQARTVVGATSTNTEAWLSRTITGLTPGASYTARVMQYGWMNGVGNPQMAIRVAGGTTATNPNGGSTFYLAGGTEGGFGPLAITATADGAGAIVVSVGLLSRPGSGVEAEDLSWWFRDVLVIRAPVVDGAGPGTLVPPTSTAGRIVTSSLADASGRLHGLSRRAILETSADVGASWTPLVAGFLTADSMGDAITYRLTVGDTKRAEQNTELFRTADPAFGAVGCVLGGPVPGGFGGVPDYGAVRFRVLRSDDTNGRMVVALRFLSGFLPPWFAHSWSNIMRSDEWSELNAVGRRYFVEDRARLDTAAGVAIFGWFPGLAIQLTAVSGGAVTTFPDAAVPDSGVVAAPVTIVHTGGLVPDQFVGDRARLIEVRTPPTFGGGDSWDVLRVDWGATADVTPPANGTDYDVLVYPWAVSEESPIHVAGHPCDLAVRALAFAGLSVDGSSLADTKTAIDPTGASHLFQGMYGGPVTVADFVAALGKFYGFAHKPTAVAGTVAFFPTRAERSIVQTITEDDLREPGNVFLHSEETVVTAVNAKVDRYRRWTRDDPGGQRPLDMIATSEEQIEGTRGDASVYGTKTHVLDLSGAPMLLATGETDFTKATPLPLRDYMKGTYDPVTETYDGTGAGDVIIDRFGRGAVEVELSCLPSVTATIGDWVEVTAGHMPINLSSLSPTTQRMRESGGSYARTMVVVRRTETPVGPELRLLEVGAVVQVPLAAPPPVEAAGPPLPTLTLATDATFPSTRVVATLTNATDEASAGATVTAEYLVQAGAPSADDPGTVFGTITPGQTPATVTTSDVPAASLVWVRMQARLDDGTASAWSAWASLNLDTATGGASGLPTPVIVPAVDGAGVVSATVNDAAGYDAVYLVAGSVGGTAPDEAATLAGTPDTAAPYSFAALATLDEGEVVYLSAVAVDALGNQSALTSVRVVRETAPGSSGLTPGTYGSSTESAIIVVGAGGTITSVTETTIAGGGGGGGGGGTSDLPDTTGLLAEWDASTGFVPADPATGRVMLFPDGWLYHRHMNAGVAASTTALYQGILTAGAINGLAAIEMDAVDDGYQTSLVVSPPYTVFLVFRTRASIAAGQHRVLQGKPFNWLIGFYDVGGTHYVSHYANGWVSQTSLAAAAATTYVCIATNDGTASRFYVNGTDHTQTSTFVGPPGPLTIGHGELGQFGEMADAFVGHVGVFSGAKNSTDVGILSAALVAKWI